MNEKGPIPFNLGKALSYNSKLTSDQMKSKAAPPMFSCTHMAGVTGGKPIRRLRGEYTRFSVASSSLQ